MKIHLFDLKAEMQNSGEKIINFLDNNFTVNYYDPHLRVIKVISVEERHLCNPFLLAFEAYGNNDSVDILLKFNQITNPFSIDLYDIILVPELNAARRFYKKSKDSIPKAAKDTKALFIDPTRASKKDVARLEQLQKLANKRSKGSAQAKPTNLLRDGEVPFSTDGQRLVFAPSISKPRNQG